MPLVEIKDVTKRYGAFEVLKGLSLEIQLIVKGLVVIGSVILGALALGFRR